MLKLAAVTLAVVGLSSAAVAQVPAFGEPDWIPGQTPSTLTLYSEAGLQGRGLLIVRPSGNLSASFRAASLKTTGGAWEVCDAPNFRGQCQVVDGWQLSLNRDLGLRQVRSMRPVERVAPQG